MTDAPYRLLGGPGSPYSLKLRAALRYRRLPHHWIVPTGYLNSPGSELAKAGKATIPVLQFPEDGSYHADTTPLIYALEARHPGQRSLIPDDPADAFLAHLIEDFADEFLVNALFVFRWVSPEDLAFSPRRQLQGWLGTMPAAQFEAFVAKFMERQTAQIPIAGGGPGNKPLLEMFYRELLDAIETLVTESRYLFGTRPSLAEIGLFGQLSQMAIDHSASRIMKAAAPRAFQWVQDLDDASGIDGHWRQPGDPAPAGLGRILDIVMRYYMPYAQACTEAATSGREKTECTMNGVAFSFVPRPYTAKAILWLQDEFTRLDDAARVRVLTALNHPQAEAWLTPAEGAAPAPAHLPC
ncbi:MAG: glutathione S-transferase [Rhodobacter sp.]|nr:glutathione S-transferase [Paracoccaceae bacterium]MCC0076445.1 glutathione S-transferase [Rhodobacter sp.]